MEEKKIEKFDENITLLEETIKEVGTIKEKSVELKMIIDDMVLLKKDYQEGLIKLDEQAKESKQFNDDFQKTREDIIKSLNEANQKIDKSCTSINKNIDKAIEDVNQKIANLEMKIIKIIIITFLMVIVLLVFNLFI